MDAHRVLPLVDRTLTAALPVHSEIRSVMVHTVIPTTSASTVRLVRDDGYCSATAELEVAVPDDAKTEHLTTQHEIPPQDGALDVFDHERDTVLLQKLTRLRDEIYVRVRPPRTRPVAFGENRISLARR